MERIFEVEKLRNIFGRIDSFYNYDTGRKSSLTYQQF
jgi:hypothetical protein